MGSIQGTLLNMAQENSASEGYTGSRVVLGDVPAADLTSALRAELPLADYLRRGPAPYFAPSVSLCLSWPGQPGVKAHALAPAVQVPAYYLLAEGTEDVLLGVKFALDNGLKLSFRGGGVCVTLHWACPTTGADRDLARAPPGRREFAGGQPHDRHGCAQGHLDRAGDVPVHLPGTGLHDLRWLQWAASKTSCAVQAGLLGIELANATAEYGLHYRCCNLPGSPAGPAAGSSFHTLTVCCRIGHAASNGVAGFTLGGGGGWGGIAVDQIRGMSVVNIWECAHALDISSVLLCPAARS